ncbi:carboxymuconolactone decarboxylase family protein [Limosilactobacillus fermentum]
MTDYQEQLAECQANNKNLFASVGEAGKGFGALHAASVADGVLDTKTKELMSLAISVVERCEGCITQHTAACIKVGASREEFAEAVSVAIMMAGGPATVYGGKALACFDQLSK